MVKTKKRQWSYVIMLGISITLFILGWKLDFIHLEPPAAGTEAEFRDGYRELSRLDWLKELFHLPDSAPDSPIVNESQMRQEAQEEQAEANGEEEFTEENMANVSDNMTEVSESAELMDTSEANEAKGAKEPFQADTAYFDDALFIGDSRTVGLSEYGNLGQAEVLANSGMSVYKIKETSFPLKNGEKVKLEELLADRKFGKIYVMLGINELGYDFDQTVKKYQEVVKLLQDTQPEAIIFLQANLHISKEKSDTSPYYNNENINRFNQAVSEMADGESIFYLDVNPLFDDAQGCLASEYTTDHTHILGKYYSTWVEWLLTQAR
ncbi:MAG: GDSL-type esterase/lipase family protein [Lachnospiraceae bacterium]|nr:GDSL-type esterase/lipase family protein [Lachnospiraceae bacterium]